MKFIDREMELETLEQEYASEGASFVVIYGRRRLGKTTLISEFIRDKRAKKNGPGRRCPVPLSGNPGETGKFRAFAFSL